MGESELDKPSDPQVRIEQKGALLEIVLDRPKALNALNFDMRAAIAEVLEPALRNPETYAICLKSSSPRAFCVGGDVREVIDWARVDRARARHAFAEEYRLDWQLECFGKPSVSLMDGHVIGSGAGLTCFNTHRVAAENYKFSMPETAIGLFPDVGVAHVLSRLPNAIGIYLGLTGEAVGRADALALGLVTHCVARDRFDGIVEGLSGAWPVDALLDEAHVDPGEGPLMDRAGLISQCFHAESVEEILTRLAAVGGSDKAWAEGVGAGLRDKSPSSLKITLRHLKAAAGQDIKTTLETDYRLACRFLEAHDFAEGVRAVLVDKDGKPNWKPDRLENVDAAMVEAYFAPLADGHELNLPERGGDLEQLRRA